jgi:ComF family protein
MSLRDDILRIELVRGLVDFLFPPLCLGCSAYTDNQSIVCDGCLKSIDRFSFPICLCCFKMLPSGGLCSDCHEQSLTLFALGNYTAPLRDLIIQFKFKGIRSIAAMFAEELVVQFDSRIAELDAVFLVPVPLHPEREHFRGYNQAHVLAQRLAPLLDIDVADDILLRSVKGRPQADQKFEKRAENIQGVFNVPRPAETAERVILVDDVVTTGSTMMEARRVLDGAGYRTVAAISVAHGL